MKAIVLLTILLLPTAASAAGEEDIRLRQGDGVDVVSQSCSVCHSLDYIQMNSPFMDRVAWEKTVTKMIKVMGAPIPDDQVAPILDYLAANYGKPPAQAETPSR